MYRVLSASKDCYITDKIINNKFRATDSNVGQAGTLDLFKLYAESVSGSDNTPTELSRILIKFDLETVKTMHDTGVIDVGDSSFKSYLHLSDVYGGQTTPSNFNIIVFPLAQSFDEGNGFDIIEFKDLGATNWVTASITNSIANLWNATGAMKSGSLGESNIDVIVSGTFDGQASPISICSEQYFESGFEDLKIDITTAVSASAKSLLTNHGFLVAFSGSYEKDSNSYFVKRFASRNTVNTTLRPKLSIQYDDTVLDNHGNFVFDFSGSLYLNNFYRGVASNIKLNDYTELAATDAMILKIRSGSFSKDLNVSQAIRGENRITGVYSSSFAISSYNVLNTNALKTNSSLTYDAIWSSADESVTYLSSSLIVKKNKRTSYDYEEKRLLATTLNLNDRYNNTDQVKIRLFIENVNRSVVFTKGPVEKLSEIFENVYYSVKDFNSGRVIVPFDTVYNSTRLSTDSSGMYYDFYMSSLPRGRTYIFEYLVQENGIDTYIKDAASKFIVE